MSLGFSCCFLSTAASNCYPFLAPNFTDTWAPIAARSAANCWPALPSGDALTSCNHFPHIPMSTLQTNGPLSLWLPASPGRQFQVVASPGQLSQHMLRLLLLLQLPQTLSSQRPVSICSCPQSGCARPVFSAQPWYIEMARLTSLSSAADLT